MAQDILFTLGIEGDTEFLSQINKVINSVNSAFSTIKMPSLPDMGSIAPKIDLTNFNVAQASVGELEKAYEQLRADFVQGGDATLLTQVNKQLQALNRELSNTQEKAGKKPFDIATASAGELQKELSRLQRTFVSGMDTRQIVAVRDRLRETRIEMGQINGQSFTQRLRQAFTESLQDATNWQQRVLEIAGGNIIANLFENVGQGVINAGKYAINSAGQFESLRASLNVIAGSDGLGGVLFDQFQKLASKSPFNFDDVGEQGTKLLAMGIPIADVTDRLSRIGDVAAGVGREKLPSIVYAYGQIKSQGKAMAGDLSQFINAGVPIIEVLAETLKKPQSEIKNLASTGKISFKDIDTALLAMTNTGGKFFQMMQTQSNTFEGLWSSMEDSFQLLAASIGQEMLPVVKDIVIGITDAVSAVTDFISGTKAIDNTNSVFASIATGIAKIAAIGAGAVFSTLGDILGIIADNALALSLIIGGLTIAFKAATIAAYAETAAIAISNAVSTAAYTVGILLTNAIYFIESAYIALSTATWSSVRAAVAFWLASNPVGWIALGAAIAGAGVAYLVFSDSAREATQQEKYHAEVVGGLIDKYESEKSTVDGLFNILNSSKGRDKQIKDTQAVIDKYGDLFPKMNVEKDILGETETSVKKKQESQAAAAKQLIEQYGEILPKYITEKSLIGDSAEAEKTRAEAREIIHKRRLEQISEEYIRELQMATAKELIALEIEKSTSESLDKQARERGKLATIQRGLDRMLNDQTRADFKERKDLLEAKEKELQNNKTKIVQDAFDRIKKIDSGGAFDEKAWEKNSQAAATSVQYAVGSIKDLQEKLKVAKETMESVSPSSNAFLKAAANAKQLEDKIKNINEGVKLLGISPDSLAGLQARLSIIQQSINETSPNTSGFDALITKSVEYNDKIKAIQDRIKVISLAPGSMEFLNFQVSKVTEQLNKQPSGSGLIPGLIAQSKELADKIRDLKIEYGLEPPRNSLSGINNSISELQKKLSETTDNALLKSITKDIVALEKSARIASGQLAIMKAVAEGKATESTGIIRANPIDYAKYVQDLGSVIRKAQELRKEIATLESSTALSVNQLLSLEGKKAALSEMEKTLPSGYENVNTAGTDINVPTDVNSSVFAPSIQPIGIDKIKEDLAAASTAYADFFGLTTAQSQEFATTMVGLFDQIKGAIESGISQGIGNAAFAFGEGIGNMIMGMGSFQDAVSSSLFALGQAFLVEIPKAIGMFLIQTAVGMMVSSLGTMLPAALPVLLIGLGLVGGSGIASGILGGLQKKRQKEQEGKKEIPNVNQAFGGSSSTGANEGPALGMSAQSADKPVLTNVINITMPVVGVDGIILSTLQSQQIIQQQLK